MLLTNIPFVSFKRFLRNRKIVDRELVAWFMLCFAVAYLVPGSLIHDVRWMGSYTRWFMGKFPVMEQVAKGSIDPDGYRIFFTAIIPFIPFFVVAHYFKPVDFGLASIHVHKIGYFLGWTFFYPLLIYGVTIFFQQENFEPSYFVLKILQNAAQHDRVMLVLVYGGMAHAYGFIIAVIITWFVNVRSGFIWLTE